MEGQRIQSPGYAEREVSWAREYAATSDASSRRVVRCILGNALLGHQIASDGILDPAHRAEFESDFADDTAAIREALSKIDSADAASGISTADSPRGPVWSPDRLDDFSRSSWRGARLRPGDPIDARTSLARIDLGNRTQCSRDEIPGNGAEVLLRSSEDGPHWLAAPIGPDALQALLAGHAAPRNAIRSSKGPMRILTFAPKVRAQDPLEVTSSWKVDQRGIPDAFL